MTHHTYFEWTELRVGDRFRVAGYNDVLQKLNGQTAVCVSRSGTPKPRFCRRFGERIEVAPNVGLLMVI